MFFEKYFIKYHGIMSKYHAKFALLSSISHGMVESKQNSVNI